MTEIKPVRNPGEAGAKRQRAVSGTAFPYFDLDSSIKVAEVVHLKGGGKAAPDEVAAWLGYTSTKSGTYLTRIAASRQFGLIQTADNLLAITERARKILGPVLPEDAINAKIDAFLAVELFSKVYEEFRGRLLPPEVGLKNLFQGAYKIVPDRAPQAVRVFFNSAEQAGFFKTTGDRTKLIRPSVSGSYGQPASEPVQKDPPEPVPEKPRSTGGGGDGPSGVHSAIIGLLRDLPPPGTIWNARKKQRFLDAFKAAIDFIYPEEDEP